MIESQYSYSRRAHDKAVWIYWRQLLDQGHRTAHEVGIPGGRLDILVLDEDDRWVEIFEVKTRNPATGIAQLERYGATVGGDPRLTLVVDTSLATPELEEACRDRVRLVSVEFSHGYQESLLDFGATAVFLPYLHPSATRSIVAKNRAWWLANSHRFDGRDEVRSAVA